MDQDTLNTEQQNQQVNEIDQTQQQEQQEGFAQGEEQQHVQQYQINNDCGLMPEFKSADYSNLESIKNAFAPVRNINDINFTIPHQESAVFLKLSSVNKDHLHKAVKYGYWTSTAPQNNEIEKAFQLQLKNPNIHIYIYFFYNNSLFGMAELKDGFNPTKSFQLWTQQKFYFGVFSLEWIFVGKVDINTQDIKQVPNQKIYLTQESGLKLLEYAMKADFTTVFNDFEEYDLKEKELREQREQQDSDYYRNFCYNHSKYEHHYAKGQDYHIKNKHYQHHGDGQNRDQYKGNGNKYMNKNRQFQQQYHNMNNQNYKQQMIDPSQFQMFPIIDQQQFQQFIDSQPRIHINYDRFQVFKKPYNKQYNNQYNNNGNYQKGFKNNRYQNQYKPQYNQNLEQTADQSPQVENVEGSTEQTQQNEEVYQQQQQQVQKNYQYHNYNKKNGNYFNNYNNNNQMGGNYQSKPYYNKNYNNYQNQNYVNGNNNNHFNNGNNYNNQGKYNNRNYKQYNNQNRQQHRQNQYQGFQGNQNEFPHFDQLNQDNNIQQLEQHQTDIAAVEQHMDAINMNQ